MYVSHTGTHIAYSTFFSCIAYSTKYHNNTLQLAVDYVIRILFDDDVDNDERMVCGSGGPFFLDLFSSSAPSNPLYILL